MDESSLQEALGKGILSPRTYFLSVLRDFLPYWGKLYMMVISLVFQFLLGDSAWVISYLRTIAFYSAGLTLWNGEKSYTYSTSMKRLRVRSWTITRPPFSIAVTPAREEFKEFISSLARIPATANYEKYLGLQALVGRSNTHTFTVIKGWVHKKLVG
jgi:hypothetical protein